MNNDVTKGANRAIDLSVHASLPVEPVKEPDAFLPIPAAEVLPAGREMDAPGPAARLSGPGQPGGRRPLLSFRRMAGFALIVVALGVSAVVFVSAQGKPVASTTTALARLPSQSIPLAALSQSLLASQSAGGRQLTVNGQLSVTGPLVLVPGSRPTTAVAGELYYDQAGNSLEYYNGTQFVNLQGGGNVTNNVTNVAGGTTNVTNVTNVNNATGGTADTGTPGDLAYFATANTLGDSLINESGTTLTAGGTIINIGIGNGVQSVAVGSSTGAAATAIQGGTGNVAINTGDTTGSSGNITIQSGDSSTAAAGNVSIDTGNSVLSGTVVADKTFEDGIDNMADGVFGDNSVITQSAAQAHGGTHSLAIAVGSNFFPEWAIVDGGTNPPYKIPATAGHTYAFSAWVRADTNSDDITAQIVWSTNGYGGGGEISQQTFGTVTDITTAWRKVTGVLTAPVGTNALGFFFTSSDAQTVGEVHYFDDMTVTDLSSSSAAAALNLGATNAQVITIGNSGMLAPTTIYGGGITLNGGSGFINISGSNIAATSGGATYATTTGALDITAATSSAWQIAASSGDGGDLNIAAGDAGGNGNGGNLVLQSGAAAGTGAGGSVIVQPGTDSAAAFQVQDSSGGDTPLLVDTTTGKVRVDASGLNSGTTADSLTFGESSSGEAIASKRTPGGNQDGLDFYTNSADVFSLSNGGWATFKNRVDNAAGFQVQDAAGNQLFDIDTSGDSVVVPSASFVTASGGFGSYSNLLKDSERFSAGAWTTGGSVLTPSDDSVPAPNGTTTGSTITTTGSTNLLSQQVTVSPSTVYTFSWWAKGGTMTPDQYSVGDVTHGSDIVASTGYAIGSNWQRFSATFTTPAGCTSIAVYPMRDSGAISAGTIYLWGAQLEQASTAGVYVATGATAQSTASNGLVVDGDTLLKNQANSATAFQVQDQTGTALLTADTATMTVTVKTLVVTADLTVDGHIITGGSTPAFAAGAAANCSGAGSVSVAGDDTSGMVTIITGAGPCPAAGDLADITFANAFGATPHIVLSPAEANGSTLQYYTTASATGFSVETNSNTLSGATTYKYNYLATQ